MGINEGFDVMLDNFSIPRKQDLQLSDVDLKAQYYSLVYQGKIGESRMLIEANPSLKTEIIDAAQFNTIINYALELEQQYFTDVPNKLEELQKNFQFRIDNLVYMATYDEYTTYNIGNFVMYLAEIYMCIKPTTGNLPTNTEFWLYLGLKGAKGVDSLGTTLGGVWKADVEYKYKDVVAYDLKLWVSLVDGNMGRRPEINPDAWLMATELKPLTVPLTTTAPTDQERGQLWFQEI